MKDNEIDTTEINDRELSGPEKMFDSYRGFSDILDLFHFTGGFSLFEETLSKNVSSPIIVKGENTAAKLFSYYLKTYANKNITLEQASSFAPIFTTLTMSYLPDLPEVIDEIADGPELRTPSTLSEEIKTLFDDKTFWHKMDETFEYYILIEKYLEKELDRIHTEHPEAAKVRLNDLKALVFAYKPFTEEELEPLFETVKQGRLPRSRHFDLIYYAVGAAIDEVNRIPEPSTELIVYDSPTISRLKLSYLSYPLDAVTRTCFSGIEYNIIHEINVTSKKDKKAGKEINILVRLRFEDFSNFKGTETLTAYEKRIFVIICTLAQNNIQYATFSQIIKAAGRKKPTGTDYKNLYNALLKLKSTILTFDNSQEIEANYKYRLTKLNTSLVDIDIIYEAGSGKRSFVYLIRPPVLFEFARIREQVDKIPASLYMLETVNGNDAIFTIVDTLIPAIIGAQNNVVLYSTIFDKCKVKEPRQQRRIKEYITKVLEEYKSNGNIKSYSTDNRSITIERKE